MSHWDHVLKALDRLRRAWDSIEEILRGEV